MHYKSIYELGKKKKVKAHESVKIFFFYFLDLILNVAYDLSFFL